jgi:hypothetical protein
VKSADASNEGRLSGTVIAEKRQNLTVPRIEADATQRMNGPEPLVGVAD